MRLYLEADSEKHIGYTPDWIQISYSTKYYEYHLTLDIQGEIDYKNDSLSCRCKGDLVPWVLVQTYKETGETAEIDLFDPEILGDVKDFFTSEKIEKLFSEATEFVVGIYPVDDDNDDCEDDVLTNCKGLFEYIGIQDFKFEVERNY